MAKNFLIYSCLILMLLSSFGLARHAFAEPGSASTQGYPPTQAPSAEQLRGTGAGSAPAATQQSKGFLGWVGGHVFSAVSWVVKFIALGLLGFFAWILAMSGLLLNISIQFLVIGMGDMVLRGGFGVPIDTLWTLIRNLVNISFIFALIYIGITTIIDSHASHAKSLLISVIISALLVNFSLFFAKATIDVSNILADAIYKKMVPDARLANVQTGVSAAFMDKLGIAPLMVSPENKGAQDRMNLMMADEQGGVGFTLLYALGASLLMFKLAFAFGIGAFLLIIRFVMLIFLMILSPLAFLPEMLPGLGGYRKKWMSALISQSFLAPVYLFGLYVILLILQSTPIHTGSEGLANLFPSGGGAAGTVAGIQMLLYFVIAIVLIIGVSGMAKSMASTGTSLAGNAANWGEKKVKGLISKPVSFGLAAGGYVGRQTLGRYAHTMAQSDDLKTRSREGGFGGWKARSQLKAARKLEDSTFDARNVDGVKASLGVAGVDAGKGAKDGFKSYMHHKEEEELKFAESLNVDESPGMKKKTTELEEELKTAQQKVRDLVKGNASREDIGRAKDKVTTTREELADHKKEVIVSKSANQYAYAKTIEEGHLNNPDSAFHKWSFWPLRTAHDNQHIADHIRKAIDKKKNKSATDDIKDMLEKATKKDDHGSGGGGGDAHPPEAPKAPTVSHAEEAHPPDTHAAAGHGH